MTHVLAGIAWDPQIRGFLALLVGLVVLLGSVYLVMVTNLGTRLGFLIAAAAFWGWMAIMGLGLGDLRHRRHARRRCRSGRSPRSSTRALEQAGLQEAQDLDTSGLPPAERAQRARGRRRWSPPATSCEPGAERLEAAAGVQPELRRGQGHGGRVLRPEPRRGAGDRRSPTDYVPVYSFERGGKKNLDDDPTRIERITKKLRDIVQVNHPTHYAIVQVQPVIEQEARAGRAAAAPRGRSGRRRSCR